jgi:hypothetical protein
MVYKTSDKTIYVWHVEQLQGIKKKIWRWLLHDVLQIGWLRFVRIFLAIITSKGQCSSPNHQFNRFLGGGGGGGVF